MKVDGNSLRPGNVIEVQDRLWRVVKTQHVKPGKGGAFLQVELKDIRHGTKFNTRFRSAETVERVRLEQREYLYLYQDGSGHAFMDQESFDQHLLGEDLISADQAVFLQENMVVMLELYEGTVIGMSLPETVILTVNEADAVVKGQTAAASYKPAIMDNGLRVMVPPYIEPGVKIVVNTADASFVERVKS
ncbi:MAG: elongation factor P [Pseudomonadota bacterium]